ncbi:Histidine kinase-, DNA gyrase B-, and HSP90-like ATPase [Bhargavaea beijingensis]|uniref:histidine kinase n=1 Tax=Bhargavaea beijingensis TaxID=426756 RepID=A0A1G6YWK5_9BACL|nr:HAMP domain-containing sensor histidine kinase [Bhargavaea beijingensis]SDD94691.1 Histidine kinase-, DNA gyrase B-, and HSP90-like ATPase [Bhargavaea beijingensis]
MPKHKWTQAVWLFLAAFVLFSVMVLIEAGPRIIGKTYTESEDFRGSMDFFYNQIGPYILNPVDPEEAKKTIGVTEEELDDHRYRYGNLEDQLASIRDQYEGRIGAAEDAGEKKELTAERDEKLEDIRQNFLDDDHVAEKVRAEKGRAIDEYMKALGENRPSFEHQVRHVYYELTDTATGKTYTNGNIREKAAYKREFNEKNGYLRASQITGDLDYTGEADSLIPDEVKTFEGTVIVPQSVLSDAADRGMADAVYLNDDQLIWGYAVFKAEQRAYMGVWLAGILALALMLTVFRLQPSVWTGSTLSLKLERFPIDGVTAAAAVASLIALAFAEYMKETFMNFVHHTGSFLYSELTVNAAFFMAALGVAVFLILHVVRRFTDSGRIGQDLERAYIRRAADDLRAFFLNRKLGTQVLFLLIVVFLAGLGFGGVVLSVLSGFGGEALVLGVIWLFLFFTVALPVLLLMARRTGYLNRIIDATGRMAAGRFTEEVPVRGTSVFAKHASDLNRLREGVRLSMSEQARSERLKTELITNVSHDLRTPLTSIITYTDLLKKPGLTEEERAEYVDVLDRKSQRLKTLIDDLFDVSKMATGNVELNRQRVDLGELVRQAIAEHGEEIAASPLDFRISIADGALPASVDGQKWWRVIDNLIQNALKYAMPGTRVYVSLDEAEEGIRFTIKNVSKYELGDNADELFERFKRGDASRHTEGSGLGLAIAQSIVDLHGGRMTIDLDGDLFKVTVEVPRA